MEKSLDQEWAKIVIENLLGTFKVLKTDWLGKKCNLLNGRRAAKPGKDDDFLNRGR